MGVGREEDAWPKCLQVCEKFLANWKDAFRAFMDLEKEFDTIDWHGRVYGVRVYRGGGKLLKAAPQGAVNGL